MPKIRGIDIPKESDVKNYLINGDMRLAQRNTSFAAVGSGTYTLDRFQYNKSGAMVHTLAQISDAPTLAQAGYLFQNSLDLTLTTPDTSIAAGDFAIIQQSMEGYNWAALAQKPFTMSFWVKATTVGTYCVAFQSTGADRSYVAEYTINTTNTWEYKTVTVLASPSAGTWNYSNGTGLKVIWTVAGGSTFQTGNPGSWQSATYIATANQVNGVNTGATNFRITGVMINSGLVAAPFRLFADDVEGEVAACQRYYEKSYDFNTALFTITNNGAYEFLSTGLEQQRTIPFKVRKRTVPTVSSNNPTTSAAGSDRAYNVTTASEIFMGKELQGDGFFSINQSGIAANQIVRFHWYADAEL